MKLNHPLHLRIAFMLSLDGPPQRPLPEDEMEAREILVSATARKITGLVTDWVYPESGTDVDPDLQYRPNVSLVSENHGDRPLNNPSVICPVCI